MEHTMAKGIWKELRESTDGPIMILAPMEDVTDTVFRRIVNSCGRPDLSFTEFTSATGINSPGRDNVMARLRFLPEERPLIAQIWGRFPEDYLKAAKELAKMDFDGIDINMGCPVAKIIKKGSCSALIKNPTLAGEIISAVKEGAGDLDVSVKTRIGFDTIVTDEWCGFLLEQDLDALIVHGRTTKEMSKAPANWDEIAKVVAMRDQMGKETVIVGNGDVKSMQQAKEYGERYKVDGVMFGRAVLENQWVFNEDINVDDITPQMRIDLLLKHLDLWEKTWGDKKPFAPMKKFVKAYVKGFEGAAEVRAKLMLSKSAEELKGSLTGLS